MANNIDKYLCRCGNRVNKLISYFVHGSRITVCDNCAESLGLNKEGIEKIEYKKEKLYQTSAAPTN